MSVTFDKLLNWPDPGAIDSAALDLSRHGEEFGLAVEDAKFAWGRLASCYETPHQDRLYRALDSAVEFATTVSSGTATAASALGVFSATLASMRPRRDDLVAQAKAANAAPVPEQEDEAEEQAKQHRELQRQIDAHAKAYEEAVTQCEQDISGMRDDGLPAGWRENEWSSYAGDSAISTLAAGAESHHKQATQVRRRLIFRLFGKNLRVPLPGETRVRTSWRFVGKPPSGTYGQRFITLLRQAVLGPPLGRYSPWRTVKPGPTTGRFGVGVSAEARSKIGVSGWGRLEVVRSVSLALV